MKACRQCKNQVFDIDINDIGLCESCYAVESEKLVHCKECNRSIKIMYSLPGPLCGQCGAKTANQSNTETLIQDHQPGLDKNEAIGSKKELGQQIEAPIGTNSNALIGFILSVTSIFGLGLAGIIGFVMGIVALAQIRHTREGGRGLAIAAIIIGAIWGILLGILRRLVEAGY